jgi:hypothetical protein
MSAKRSEWVKAAETHYAFRFQWAEFNRKALVITEATASGSSYHICVLYPKQVAALRRFLAPRKKGKDT